MATVEYTLPTQPLMLEAVVGDAAIIYNASDVRLMLGALYPRPGRIGIGDALWLYPRQAGANWSLDVQAGQAVIPATASAYAPERYLVTLPARTNLSLVGFNTAPPATRTHAVWLVVDDKSLSGIAYAARLVVTEDTGTGAPNPTASAYRQVGTVTIAPGQANITATHLGTIMIRASSATTEYAFPVFDTGIDGGYISGNSVGGQTLRYSLDGNTVRMQGSVQRATGSFAVGTAYTVGLMPVGYRPAYARLGVIASAAPNIARVLITTAGELQVIPYAANPSAMPYACFDGFSYEIN